MEAQSRCGAGHMDAAHAGLTANITPSHAQLQPSSPAGAAGAPHEEGGRHMAIFIKPVLPHVPVAIPEAAALLVPAKRHGGACGGRGGGAGAGSASPATVRMCYRAARPAPASSPPVCPHSKFAHPHRTGSSRRSTPAQSRGWACRGPPAREWATRQIQGSRAASGTGSCGSGHVEGMGRR